MLVSFVAKEIVEETFYVIGIDFTVMLRQSNYFVPRCFYGTCFMDIDMCGFSGQHAFMTSQYTVDYGSIGLRAAN